MKAGYTHFAVIIDRSGSMGSIKTDTEGGLNAFITSQKSACVGEATVSLVIFDNFIDVIHDFINIQDFPPFVLEPRGSTALLDAVGQTINNLGIKLVAMNEEDRPEKVAVIIITDGEENSSHEFSYADITGMIKRQTEDYKWEFVFLGANMDAVQVASQYGITASKAMTFAANAKGVKSSYDSLSKNMMAYRSCSADSASMDFDLADRDAQKDAGVQ